jgi:transcription termination/antitermination protein NusG
MHSWYVVQVLSAQEKKIKKALEDQRELMGMTELIEEILLPTENVSEVAKGQHRVVEKRVWPGYLLIKMTLTDDSWAYVKNTQGVIGFPGGDKPTPLTEREVEEILKDIAEKKQKITQKHKFEVGNTVKIIDGVFVNFIGTITEVQHEKGKLSVSVSIFGRETQVGDLEFSQVEEVSEDAENI